MRDCNRNTRWWVLACAASVAALAVAAPVGVRAQGQEPRPPEAQATADQPQPQQPSAGQVLQPAGPVVGESEWTVWTSGRYRITPGDVIELRFPFVPELDQTLSVQPDGYVTLREAGDLRVQGRTLPQLRADVTEAYMPFVRDPVFTAVLKEFEKPYLVAAGEVSKPGRYELRGATTLTQAIAYAGGGTKNAKMSEVVIFRPFTEDAVSVKQIDVKAMFDKRDLSEDPLLRPGDTIFLSKSALGKMEPVLSKISLGIYFNPFQFIH